jgi:hypothetical protein
LYIIIFSWVISGGRMLKACQCHSLGFLFFYFFFTTYRKIAAGFISFVILTVRRCGSFDAPASVGQMGADI